MKNENAEDQQFHEDAIVEAFVPFNTELPVTELLEAEGALDGEVSSVLLPWIRQREFLLLDESVKPLVVLKAPPISSDDLAALLARLEVSVELWATGISPTNKTDEQRASTVKELISENKVDAETRPIIFVPKLGEKAAEQGDQHVRVVWPLDVILHRPRTKLAKLSVSLVPSVHLRPIKSDQDDTAKYLPSLVPLSINLLQPFTFDPRFAGRTPYLPASRITKITPAAPAREDTGLRLRATARRLLRAGPALFWRIRFSQTTAPPRTNWLLAALELEVTPLWNCKISVKTVRLTLARGSVEFIGPEVPRAGKPGDHFTVMYKLIASTEDDVLEKSKGLSDKLDISIKAVAEIAEGCKPEVNISWTTTVDLTAQKRPPSRPASQAVQSLDYLRRSGPDSLPFSGDGALEKPATPTGPTGISVSITGPDKIVLGEPFSWEVFVVNRSTTTQNLALIPIRKLDSQLPISKLPPSERDIYDMPISWFFEPSDLSCLSTIVRTGPLAASGCSTSELKFCAAASGPLRIDAVRVVDLSTRQFTDITDLPDIVVGTPE